jgi:hypothetical protein
MPIDPIPAERTHKWGPSLAFALMALWLKAGKVKLGTVVSNYFLTCCFKSHSLELTFE